MLSLAVALSAISQPTYNKDVSRILAANCAGCHHPGTAAPFSLQTYDDATKWADNIREAIADRRMPPWYAHPAYGKFSNDRRLSAVNLRTLFAWIDSDRLEGKPSDLPAPVSYPVGWQIGEPDVILDMPGPVQEIPASGIVGYKWLKGTVKADKDLWITAAEVLPGTRAVVHHCQIYTNSSEIISYAPGTQPVQLPPDTIVRLRAGEEIKWMMHYIPYGKPATDQSRLGLKLWQEDRAPKWIRRFLDISNTNVTLAPGQKDVRVVNSWRAPERIEFLSVLAHMHLRGKDFRLEVQRPDGSVEVPLVIPQWNFAWQMFYEFAEPLVVPSGTVFRFISHYDNSPDNPNNPDPTATVRGGPLTSDEMQTVQMTYREPFDPDAPDKPQYGAAVEEGPISIPVSEIFWSSVLLGVGIILFSVAAIMKLINRPSPGSSPRY